MEFLGQEVHVSSIGIIHSVEVGIGLISHNVLLMWLSLSSKYSHPHSHAKNGPGYFFNGEIRYETKLQKTYVATGRSTKITAGLTNMAGPFCRSPAPWAELGTELLSMMASFHQNLDCSPSSTKTTYNFGVVILEKFPIPRR